MKLKIKTPIGNYYYKYIPIYLGIKPITRLLQKRTYYFSKAF